MTDEDIESFNMQVRLNMPVVTSTYPSLQTYNHYGLKTESAPQNLPSHENFWYRVQFFKNYQLNRKFLYDRIRTIKSSIPTQFHRYIDEWDQEHALILGEGASMNGVQSVILKPSNVNSVTPLIERQTERVVKVPESFKSAAQVNFWILNADDPRDILHLD